ncbi:hypothetical protein TNIN_1851 [Trichonephila inaurata madagascariensis]|uniref:Uncharacterized protein n=1 Tax=Trichonephila inaurata madagascariensis TaxID=2747483 RepID=A0A8X6I7I4_9ARAC|nr:hypothetical protein TNIN_1851 [Trichonephila inaurata madagascariensis]
MAFLFTVKLEFEASCRRRKASRKPETQLQIFPEEDKNNLNYLEAMPLKLTSSERKAAQRVSKTYNLFSALHTKTLFTN